MTDLKLNETPVRTARNFNINNIKIKDVKLLDKKYEFNNIEITGITDNTIISTNVSNRSLKYGVRNRTRRRSYRKGKP